MLRIKHNLALLLMLLLCFGSAVAQNVGIGTLTPDVSALLHINANNKGLLIPKVSLANLTDAKTIDQPANGLMVFNTNANLSSGTGFYFNSGGPTAAVWEKFQTGSTSGGGWGLSGNAGTDSTLNFIGTRDAKPLTFRVGNGFAGQIGFGGGLSLGKGANGSTRNSSRYLIAIGDSALYNNTDSFNIAIGGDALYNNTTGTSNTAIGNSSMLFTTVGGGNVGVGDLTLASNDSAFNTAVGFRSLENSQEEGNTGVGAFSLNSNLGGFYNTALGFETMFSNDYGAANTAVGMDALVSNTDGILNTSSGFRSLYNNATGDYNTAFGSYALIANTTGIYNTAIGDSAGVSTGALFNTTTVGYRATATASNTVRIGNTAVTSIGGQVGWSVLSDGRYKKDVNEDIKGLDFIMQLRPVSYHYNFNQLRSEENANLTAAGANTTGFRSTGNFGSKLNGTRAAALIDAHFPGASKTINKHTTNATQLAYNQEVQKNDQIRYTGFIAQEVEAAAAKVGFDFSGIDKPKNDKDHYALRYAEFVVPLVKAMQEQQAIIAAQNKKIEELTTRLEKIEQKQQ